MDGIDGLLHLMRGFLFLGALGDGYRTAVQQPPVGVGVNVHPASWVERPSRDCVPCTHGDPGAQSFLSQAVNNRRISCLFVITSL